MTSLPSRKTVPRLLTAMAGVVLSGVLLVLLVRSVDIHRLGTDISGANYWILALALLPSFLILLLKVERWRLLFGSDAPRRPVLFAALNVGYAVNSLLPARAGDVVSAYWLRSRAQMSLVRTLSTIAVERVADGVAVSLMLVLTAPTAALPARIVESAAVGIALFLLLLIGMASVAHFSGLRELTVRLIHRPHRRWSGKLLGAIEQATVGLTVFRSWRGTAQFAGWTILIWASTVLQTGIALRAFHLNLPVVGVVLLTAVLFLGMAIPSAPAYIGVFDYLMVLMLGLYGVPRTPALAAALAYHALVFLPVTVIGFVYIVHAGTHTAAQLFRIGTTRVAD